MDMDMDMDSSSSATSMPMIMTFQTQRATALYAAAWTPRSPAAYAGTCIFLIALAAIWRLLHAAGHQLERRWHDRAVRRRYVVLADDGNGAGGTGGTGDASAREKRPGTTSSGDGEGEGDDERSAEATLTTRGVDERVRVVRTAVLRRGEVAAWRVSTDVPRAGLLVVQAGVGYLL